MEGAVDAVRVIRGYHHHWRKKRKSLLLSYSSHLVGLNLIVIDI